MPFELTGIYPALTTPFDVDGELDTAALELNVSRYNDTGVKGYVAFGSTGEGPHLSRDEKTEVLASLRKAAAPGMPILAGVAEHAVRRALDALQHLADSGAEGALVLTPFYYKAQLDQEALKRYYLAIADSSPLPVVLYNFPQTTGVVLEPATVAEIAKHERIVGLKDSSGNLGVLGQTLRLVPPGFPVMVGSAGILLAALQAGASGGILALAGLLPVACVEVYEAVKNGKIARATAVQTRLAPMAQTVTGRYGVPGLKAALGLAGYAGGAPRAPLAPVRGADRERIAQVLRTSAFFPRLTRG